MANFLEYDPAGLLNEFESLNKEVQQTFGTLTTQELNWQANREHWSIGQCFEHMVKANRSYFPVFDRIIRGEKKNSLSRLVTYSLRDAYLILLTHEQLHVHQARSVLQWPNFAQVK